jgi:ABC-type antimicrobial peptide transport system permease subunit
VARAEPRFQAWLFASFACVALLLAAVGLYGTLAHAVGRRTRELGIRMAVGADRTHIFTLILREGMLVFGAGLAVGIAASVLLTRVLRGFLFGVGPLDVPTYAASSVVLALIAALAMHQPARRAARADPLRSLRMD